jgi:hypothetical protein
MVSNSKHSRTRRLGSELPGSSAGTSQGRGQIHLGQWLWTFWVSGRALGEPRGSGVTMRRRSAKKPKRRRACGDTRGQSKGVRSRYSGTSATINSGRAPFGVSVVVQQRQSDAMAASRPAFEYEGPEVPGPHLERRVLREKFRLSRLRPPFDGPNPSVRLILGRIEQQTIPWTVTQAR